MTLSDFDIWYRTRFKRTSSIFTSIAFIISDLIAIMLSFGGGFFLVRLYYFIHPGHINFKSFITYWPYLIIFILIFIIQRLYPGASLAPSEEMRRLSIGSWLAYGGIIFSRAIENNHWDNINTAFLISCLFSAFILLTFRSITHWFLYKTHLTGIPTVIYGTGKMGKLLADCLLDSDRTGYVPVLMLDNDNSGELSTAEEYRNIPIIYDTSIGPELVKRYNIKMAMVAMPELDAEKLKTLLNSSVSAFRYNVLIPNFFSISTIWMSVRDFNGVLGIEISHKFKHTWNLGVKRTMDILYVTLGGILVLPFLLLTALLIKITSSGPVLYKHKRLGKNGRYFYAYKFRSMVIDAEQQLEKMLASDPAIREEWEKNQKLQNDPRITAIGKFLRRTSIDEFPQLINIIKGEMSLVGPRPVVDSEVGKYGEDFQRIFSIQPGLTGLWQVSGRSDKNYKDRVAFDTYYLQSWSLWLDLWILFRTIGVVLKGKGAY